MGVVSLETDRTTRDRLGAAGLALVRASLWPKDCQTCGRPLGREAPALHVLELEEFVSATLHHPRCQRPEWSTGSMPGGVSQPNASWHARTILLPLPRGPRPLLLVNPTLEVVYLERDGEDWRVEPHAAFAAAGLVPAGPGLVFDQPVAGAAADPRSAADTDLTVSFALPPFFRYAAPADPPMMRAALQLGGTLVAVTHATDPDTLTTAAQVDAALNDPRTLMGWTAFGPADPVTAAAATREPAPLGLSTYVLHWNRQHLTVGRQLAHTATAMTDREAREWATQRLGNTAKLIDWSRVDRRRPDDGWRTMDALALRQYVLRQHEDGWRLVHVLSTVDGPRDQELTSEASIRIWAEQALALRDGPAQRDLPWQTGPTTAGSHTLVADVIH